MAVLSDFPETDRLIYNSDTMQAIVSPATERQHDLLVVTFGSWAPKDYVQTGLSRDTLRSAGIDAVHVMPVGNHWYQYPDIEEMLAAVKMFAAGYDGLVTLGQSMGGYAALRAAAGLGAVRCVAFSPQFTIDASKTDWDPGWHDEANGLNFIWDGPEEWAASPAPCSIVYDPRIAIDRQHAKVIGQHRPAQHILLPFGGHYVWTALREAGVMPHLLIELVTGTVNLARFRGKVRAGRLNSARYWNNMAMTSPRFNAMAKARLQVLQDIVWHLEAVAQRNKAAAIKK